MPRGDEKHKLIYQELVNMLGHEHVTDEPAVAEAYCRDYSYKVIPAQRAEFIVLPGSTEDVQQIVRLANRYQFPFSVTSSGLRIATCSAIRPYWCFIDPKRMNHLQIDEKNMHAVIEPYVSVAQLQAEAMKHGLFHGTTGASTQASALATNIWMGVHWTSWRSGIQGDNVLGVEWVLPNGDILRTGSLALPGGGYEWGEGPGPDARGLLRGCQGHLGSLGVITRLGVKLHPWPGPAAYHTEGVQPEKKAILPRERFRSYFFTFPVLERCVAAIREMGRAEIGAVVFQCNPWDLIIWTSKSRQEFWEKWTSDYWTKTRENGPMLWVELWGFSSPKQLEYEEMVLKEIIRDTAGEAVPAEIHEALEWLTPNAVRDAHRCRLMRVGGCTVVGDIVVDSLEDTLRSIPAAHEIRKKYIPPFGDIGDQGKFWTGGFGRLAQIEMDSIGEKTEELHLIERKQYGPDSVKFSVESSAPGLFAFNRVHSVGPAFSNVHLPLARIKRALDPDNLANPSRLIDMEKVGSK